MSSADLCGTQVRRAEEVGGSAGGEGKVGTARAGGVEGEIGWRQSGLERGEAKGIVLVQSLGAEGGVGAEDGVGERLDVGGGDGGATVVSLEQVGDEEAAQWELDARFVGHERARESRDRRLGRLQDGPGRPEEEGEEEEEEEEAGEEGGEEEGGGRRRKWRKMTARARRKTNLATVSTAPIGTSA